MSTDITQYVQDNLLLKETYDTVFSKAVTIFYHVLDEKTTGRDIITTLSSFSVFWTQITLNNSWSMLLLKERVQYPAWQLKPVPQQLCFSL